MIEQTVVDEAYVWVVEGVTEENCIIYGAFSSEEKANTYMRERTLRNAFYYRYTVDRPEI